MSADKSHDPVNHPSHYTRGNIEVIDIAKDQLSIEEFKGAMKFNALKYLCRAGHKDKTKASEDVRKGIWYMEQLANVFALQEQVEVVQPKQSTNHNNCC